MQPGDIYKLKETGNCALYKSQSDVSADKPTDKGVTIPIDSIIEFVSWNAEKQIWVIWLPAFNAYAQTSCTDVPTNAAQKISK